MARFGNTLNEVRIAAPCDSDWDQMFGNDRVRFCGQCNLNVYNLSELTRREAEEFISRNEGRLCIRFYRRADGSILTRNCPIGLRALHRRVCRVAQALCAAVISFLAGLGVFGITRRNQNVYRPIMGQIAMPVTHLRQESDVYTEDVPVARLGQALRVESTIEEKGKPSRLETGRLEKPRLKPSAHH